MSRRAFCLSLLPLLGVGLSACTSDDDFLRYFDGPSDVAILPPNQILDIHAGFVVNFRSNKIVKLDLKHETLLRDLPTASWLRSMPIALGRDRLVEQVAVTSYYQDARNYHVTLFASDSLRDELLVVPYLDSLAPYGPGCIPAQPTCAIGEPVDVTHEVDGETVTESVTCGPDSGFFPRYPLCLLELQDQLQAGQSLREGSLPMLAPDGSPTDTSVTGFWLREGKSTTDTWLVTYEAATDDFRVQGARTGLQESRAVAGETYYSDENEIEFQIEKGSTPLEDGASLTFHSDNGIRALEVPGIVSDLRMVPTQSRLLASVQIPSLNESLEPVQGQLLIYDLSPLDSNPRGLPVQETALSLCPEAVAAGDPCPEEVIPLGMDLDEQGLRLYVANGAESGGVFEVSLEGPEPSVRFIPDLPPSQDVTYVQDVWSEDGYQHLFTANLDGGTVSLYDLEAQRLVDVNPLTSAIDPIRLDNPVLGLASGEVPVPTQSFTDDGVNYQSILVGAATYAGDLYAIRAESGCLNFATSQGAFVSAEGTGWTFTDSGSESNPSLQADAETGRYVITHPCGGISRSEAWVFTYDETRGGYLVRGSRANEVGGYQTHLAYEDTRFVSDGGEISLIIRKGTLPTTDGDRFVILVDGNVKPFPAGEMPQDLEIYTQQWGDRTEPWTAVNYRTVAVIPSTLSDRVTKVDLAMPGNTSQASMYQWK